MHCLPNDKRESINESILTSLVERVPSLRNGIRGVNQEDADEIIAFMSPFANRVAANLVIIKTRQELTWKEI